MFTHLYFAKHFKHTAVGSRIEAVTCERCRTRFCYELSRAATGQAEAPYYTGQDAARQRAVAAAERALARQLNNDVELVPCPKCNWVNESLVAQYRRWRYRGAGPWIAGLLAIGVIAAPAAYFLLRENFAADSPWPLHIAAGAIAVAVGLATAIAVVRRQLRLRIDPNQTHPRHPNLPPGTPPALLPRPDVTGTGGTLLDPAPRHVGRARDPAEGAILRAGQSPYLGICAVCLAPSETTFHLPFKLREATDLPVPLCHPCASARRRKWWALVAISFLVAAGVFFALALALPIQDPVLGAMLPGGIAILVLPILIATLPGRLCRPYRYRMLDRQRSVTLFAAVNPEYTRQLIERDRPRTIPAPASLILQARQGSGAAPAAGFKA